MNYEQLIQLFPNKNKRSNFLIKVILTFGIRLDALSKVLSVDSEKLYRDIYSCGTSYATSLLFVLKKGMKKQDVASAEVQNYFNNLFLAAKKKNVEEIKKIMEVISDKEALELLNKINNSRHIVWKDEEIMIMLKYQIKYMLTSMDIERIFHIENTNYARKVRALPSEYSSLISDFDYLSDLFYKSYSHNRSKR